MAYVPVPKDLSKVKTKVAFNLTKRQILCFSVALLMGLPLFFLLKDSAGTSLAAMAMIVVMLGVSAHPLDEFANIGQLRGVRPFFSDKYDITKHPNYKYLSDYDKKNTFDMEKHLRRRPALVKPDEPFDYYEISESDLQEDTDHE